MLATIHSSSRLLPATVDFELQIVLMPLQKVSHGITAALVQGSTGEFGTKLPCQAGDVRLHAATKLRRRLLCALQQFAALA